MAREEQEKAMLKRLLNDGHGAGEDRRLTTIIKNVTRLCLSKPNDGFNDLARIILGDINLAIQAAGRHKTRQALYEKELADLESTIQEKKEAIEKMKFYLRELELEKEYAEKLLQVTSVPSCQESTKVIEDLNKQKLGIEIQLEARRKVQEELCKRIKDLAAIFDDTDTVESGNSLHRNNIKDNK